MGATWVGSRGRGVCATLPSRRREWWLVHGPRARRMTCGREHTWRKVARGGRDRYFDVGGIPCGWGRSVDLQHLMLRFRIKLIKKLSLNYH